MTTTQKSKKHSVRGTGTERLAFELCVENARKEFAKKPERARPYTNKAWYGWYSESDRNRYRAQARTISKIMKNIGWKPPKGKS